MTPYRNYLLQLNACRRWKFLKIDSSIMQKQRKVAHRRWKILKYGTFQIQVSANFLYKNPFPSWKNRWHDLNRCPLYFRTLETPHHFWDPKSTTPFRRRGSSYDTTDILYRLPFKDRLPGSWTVSSHIISFSGLIDDVKIYFILRIVIYPNIGRIKQD